MKKSITQIMLVAFVSILVISCGNIGGDSNSLTSGSSEDTNLITQKDELVKAQTDLLNMPKYKGRDVQAFQNVKFYESRIIIALSDPANPDNIDEFTYENGAWGAGNPVQISGGGDMADNLTPMKDIDFGVVPVIYNNWMEKAKEVEGADEELDYVYFSLWVPNQTREWSASSIEGTREKYNIDFNMDGSVKEFEKR